MPTYNSEKTVKTAIESVLSQTYTDWELLIMDGESNDSTLKIVSAFTDPRITVYSEPDKGVYDAMNKGIELAKGEWLYFLGSDDSLYNYSVLDNVFSVRAQADIIYGDVESSHLSQHYMGKWDIKDIGYNRCHQGIFYKKWLFDKYGNYDLRYKVHADHAFNIKVFFNRKVKTIYIPIVIAHFSFGGISSTQDDKQFNKDFSSLILNDLFWKLNDSQRIYYINMFVDSHISSLKQTFFAFILPFIRGKMKCKSIIRHFISKEK